jgi:maltose-binding protein MalE
VFDGAPDLEAFVDELPDASVMPLIAFPELAGSFSAALERVLKGQQEAAAAMRQLQDLAEENGPR